MVRVVHAILGVLAVGAMGYFGFELMALARQKPTMPVLRQGAAMARKRTVDPLGRGDGSSRRVERRLSQRNMFKGKARPVAVIRRPPATHKPAGNPRGMPAAWIKRLKLVGVVLDQEPQAIVENRRTRQTLFLRRGDRVEGAVVKEILEGKVILTYAGQSVELTL